MVGRRLPFRPEKLGFARRIQSLKGMPRSKASTRTSQKGLTSVNSPMSIGLERRPRRTKLRMSSFGAHSPTDRCRQLASASRFLAQVQLLQQSPLSPGFHNLMLSANL
jgi:hypothetical protein